LKFQDSFDILLEKRLSGNFGRDGLVAVKSEYFFEKGNKDEEGSS